MLRTSQSQDKTSSENESCACCTTMRALVVSEAPNGGTPRALDASGRLRVESSRQPKPRDYAARSQTCSFRNASATRLFAILASENLRTRAKWRVDANASGGRRAGDCYSAFARRLSGGQAGQRAGRRRRARLPGLFVAHQLSGRLASVVSSFRQHMAAFSQKKSIYARVHRHRKGCERNFKI